MNSINNEEHKMVRNVLFSLWSLMSELKQEKSVNETERTKKINVRMDNSKENAEIYIHICIYTNTYGHTNIYTYRCTYAHTHIIYYLR